MLRADPARVKNSGQWIRVPHGEALAGNEDAYVQTEGTSSLSEDTNQARSNWIEPGALNFFE